MFDLPARRHQKNKDNEPESMGGDHTDYAQYESGHRTAEQVARLFPENKHQLAAAA
jgi:hypothetical protein